MKFEDDDLKDGKLWAALQKEIDRDLAEKESGETFQEELADIEDSIEFESKETKSEDHIPDETANLSNLRSVLEATERAKDEEAKQKMKQTKHDQQIRDKQCRHYRKQHAQQKQAKSPFQIAFGIAAARSGDEDKDTTDRKLPEICCWRVKPAHSRQTYHHRQIVADVVNQHADNHNTAQLIV